MNEHDLKGRRVPAHLRPTPPKPRTRKKAVQLPLPNVPQDVPGARALRVLLQAVGEGATLVINGTPDALLGGPTYRASLWQEPEKMNPKQIVGATSDVLAEALTELASKWVAQ